MGRARIVDPDTERPPDVAGLPVLDRVDATGAGAASGTAGADGAADARGVADAASTRAAGRSGDDRFDAELCLPFELRARSRLRARLSSGAEVALVLPRGTVLRDGARLSGSGLTVRVRAADEDVVEVRSQDAQALARAAYHLGNRHVPVQVGADHLLFGYDAVLVDMLVRMGLRTRRTWAPFEPEAGAYGHGH
ncbi:MAG: urease accessory protein UreE [Burkholderiaceae bacterium]